MKIAPVSKPLVFIFPFLAIILFVAGFRAFTGGPEWTEIEVDPFRFGHNCVTVADQYIHCIGGRISPWEGFEYPDGHDVYDTSTQEWGKREPIPEVENPWGDDNVPGGGNTIMEPIAVSGNYIFLADMVMMDTHGEGRGPDIVYRAYNISGNSWILFHEDENHPPVNFSLTGATNYDNKAYFFGFTYEGGEYYTTVYQIDGGLTWNKTFQSETPTPPEETRLNTTMSGPTVASIGSKIYAFGGHGSEAHANYTKSTYVFDLADNTWTQLADMPLLRAFGAAAHNADGTKIYYFGGEKTPQVMNNDGTDTVQVYDVAEDTWTISSTPMSKTAQSDHKAVLADGTVYLILSNESITGDYEGERPEIDYYIDETFNESTEGWGNTHFSSLNVLVCPPNYSKCNYHITPGSENTEFPLFTTIEDGKKVALAEDLVGNSLAFLTEGLPEEASRIIITFPEDVFTISGSLDWDNIFVLPKVLIEPSVEPDEFEELGITIKIGGNVGLTFSKPIRLLIPGEGGKSIGYINPDEGVFNNISTVCDADDYSTVSTQLSSGGICKFDEIISDEEANLIIWTTHFTEFVTFEVDEEVQEIMTRFRNVFPRDTRCHWVKPDETTWIRLRPEVRDGVPGIFMTWTQYSANKVNIVIDDGTGSYPWTVWETLNDGHKFLPNVDGSQKIRILPINHCSIGDLSPPVSYNLYPYGWYNL
jgi:hypothetical protein